MSKALYDIILEHEGFVAVNKPAGMLTIPDRDQSSVSLKERLAEKYGAIFTVHRLDRDTSGLVLFARNEEWHKYLSRLFEERQVEKYYVGIVLGHPDPGEGDIEAPIMEDPSSSVRMIVNRKGKASHTGYRVIEANRHYSMVEFRLYTGRTHQIRVHARHIGHPLACDDVYGDGKPVYISSFKKNYRLAKSEEAERPMLSRLALHAHKLSFPLPDGSSMSLEANIPKEFRALMQQLARHAS